MSDLKEILKFYKEIGAEFIEREEKNPACVNQCPTGALSLVETNGSVDDARVPGFPLTDADPYYVHVDVHKEARRGQATFDSGGSQ